MKFVNEPVSEAFVLTLPELQEYAKPENRSAFLKTLSSSISFYTKKADKDVDNFTKRLESCVQKKGEPGTRKELNTLVREILPCFSGNAGIRNGFANQFEFWWLITIELLENEDWDEEGEIILKELDQLREVARNDIDKLTKCVEALKDICEQAQRVLKEMDPVPVPLLSTFSFQSATYLLKSERGISAQKTPLPFHSLISCKNFSLPSKK